MLIIRWYSFQNFSWYIQRSMFRSLSMFVAIFQFVVTFLKSTTGLFLELSVIQASRDRSRLARCLRDAYVILLIIVQHIAFVYANRCLRHFCATPITSYKHVRTSPESSQRLYYVIRGHFRFRVKGHFQLRSFPVQDVGSRVKCHFQFEVTSGLRSKVK